MEKHVLIVGGFIKIHRKVKELGSKITLLIDNDEILENLNRDDFKLYHRIISISKDTSIEECIEQVRTIHQIDKIDEIGSYSEKNQEMAAAISEDLNIKFNSKATIDCINNKYNMRKKLRSLGIDSINSKKVKILSDIKDFINIYGYPVILKPLDGLASVGVSLIDNENDIEKSIEWFSKNAKGYEMYIEEFIIGKEYSVEAFSENGEHKVICVTEKFKEPKHFIEIGHCIPANINSEVENEIKKFTIKILDGLEVQQGPTHTEIILTENGPHIIETHARLGGDFIPNLIEVGANIDIENIWAKQTVGIDVLDSVPTQKDFKKFTAIWFSTPNAIGKLKDITDIEIAEKSKEVVEIKKLQKIDTELKGLTHSYSRAACSIATGENFSSAVENARNSVEKVKFTVSC